MTAADRLARLFARLNPASPQNPGKPAKKSRTGKGTTTLPAGVSLRKLDEQAELARRYRMIEPDPTDPTKQRPRARFTGALSPTRCGATQSTTRSVRLDGETAAELAACLAGIDPLVQALVAWVAIPAWRPDPAGFSDRLADLIVEKQGAGKLPAFAEGTDRSQRIALAVLWELDRADACRACHSTGKVLNREALAAKQADPWATCHVCGGLGRTKLGVERRAKLIGISATTYRHSPERACYEWLWRFCQNSLTGALKQVQTARGRVGDEEDEG